MSTAIVTEFHQAQAAYKADDAASVDRFIAARAAAEAAGYHVSASSPKDATICHTAKVKEEIAPAPSAPRPLAGVKLTDPAPSIGKKKE